MRSSLTEDRGHSLASNGEVMIRKGLCAPQCSKVLPQGKSSNKTSISWHLQRVPSKSGLSLQLDDYHISKYRTRRLAEMDFQTAVIRRLYTQRLVAKRQEFRTILVLRH